MKFYVEDLLDEIYNDANQKFFSENVSQTSVTKSIGKTPNFKRSIS